MTTSGKEFITNFRNARLNPFSPSSSPSLITKGDIQKARRGDFLSPFITRYRAEGSMDTSENLSQGSSGGKNLPAIPKAPAFRYKDPAMDNNIAYWQLFMNDGIMSRYDDLMGILDKTDEIDTLEGKREFINHLKETTDYKDNKSIQTWVNDLESGFYGMGAKELSYPTALMRNQMLKAKKEYENEMGKRRGGR